MSIRVLAGILAISACALIFAATAPGVVEIQESRPLGKLVGQLWDLHYLITYEEAPYDETNELFTDTYRSGVRWRYPAWKPITFHIPQATPTSAQQPAEQVQARPTAESVAASVVAEYNASGNPGRFRVVREGDYVHIVPAGRLRNGSPEEFLPILDTKVTFLPESRSCLDTLNDLVSQVGRLRGAHIAPNVALGPSIRTQCRIEGTDLTAREVLTQYLEQVAARRYRNAWTMTYEVNSDTYVLMFYLVETDPLPQSSSATTAAQTPPAVDGAPQLPARGPMLIGVPVAPAGSNAPSVRAPGAGARSPQ